jgi:hypothetical protein
MPTPRPPRHPLRLLLMRLLLLRLLLMLPLLRM